MEGKRGGERGKERHVPANAASVAVEDSKQPVGRVDQNPVLVGRVGSHLHEMGYLLFTR